jgi:hypothetical protein
MTQSAAVDADIADRRKFTHEKTFITQMARTEPPPQLAIVLPAAPHTHKSPNLDLLSRSVTTLSVHSGVPDLRRCRCPL